MGQKIWSRFLDELIPETREARNHGHVEIFPSTIRETSLTITWILELGLRVFICSLLTHCFLCKVKCYFYGRKNDREDWKELRQKKIPNELTTEVKYYNKELLRFGPSQSILFDTIHSSTIRKTSHQTSICFEGSFFASNSGGLS